jgi:hypothetical protein
MASYIESTDRPNESAIADEDIESGEAVSYAGTGLVRLFEGSGDTSAGFLGVADDPLTGDQIALDEDEEQLGLYEASENDRVIYGGDTRGDKIKLRTAEDTGGNEPTPSIDHQTVVGFIDTSAGTLSSTAEYEGRIVEEGYEDGESTPTTYNRSNGNFVAIGVAYRDDADSYDEPVRIEVNPDLNQ